MMLFLKTMVTIAGSLLMIYLQKTYLPNGQWILLYLWAYAMARAFGFVQGLSAIIILCIGAIFYIITPERMDFASALSVSVMTSLSVWMSFSMRNYRLGRVQLDASAEIIKARGFLDKLLDNIPLMVFVKDAEELKFLNFNGAGLKLLGMERSDLIGKNDYDFFPREQADYFTRIDREVLEKKVIRDIPLEELNTPTGRRLLHTRKIPIYDEITGKPLYLLGVSEDITDKVEQEKNKASIIQEEAARRERQKIHERENILARAISSLTDTMDYQETINGVVRAVVPHMADWALLSLLNEEGKLLRTAGHHRDKSMQHLLEEFITDFPPGDEDLEVQRALRQGIPTLEKEVSVDELIALNRGKRKTELYQILGTHSTIVLPVRSPDGVIGVLSLSRGWDRNSFDELDFTLAQEMGRRVGTILDNRRLFHSTRKAVQARDEFISIASHELKTPITSLRLQLEMLLRISKTDQVSRPVANAIRQIDRLTLLVNDLLDVGRLESGKMNYHFTNESLSPIVHEVSDAMRPQFQASDIELDVICEDVPAIFVDRYRMEQALVNLLNNSLKYGQGKPVQVRLTKAENAIELKVRDFGVGIDKCHMQKIFEKFERGGIVTSVAGLGLGLYITNEIIKAFGGTIDVRSKLGEWTEFTVRLPLDR